MFIVNQEILSEKSNKKLWDWYQAKIKDIRSSGKKFYQFNTMSKAFFQNTNKGKIKVKKPKSFPLTSVFENKDFNEFQTWEYAPSVNMVINDRGYSKLRGSNNFMFNNETKLDPNKSDIEIIFFLIYISNYLDRGILYLKDTEKENKILAEQNALKFEVGYLISNPSSPIAPEKIGSEDLLRQLCVSWGVSDVSNKPIYQLRNELNDMVSTSQVNINQTQRGYELFIKECYTYGDSELRSNVMLAMEKGLLFYDDLYWKLKGKGGLDQIVDTMEAIHKAKAPDILVKKFSDNPTLKTLLMEVVRGNASTPVIVEQNQHELREALQELGYDYKELRKMKVEELKQELAKARNEATK